MKVLDGAELAGFIKERQAAEVRALRSEGILPELAIIRDSDNPIIVKYVRLKQAYGEDIGVAVSDVFTRDVRGAILEANEDASVSGIIVQLPLVDVSKTDEIVSLISPSKDVDGLAQGVLDLEFVKNTSENTGSGTDATKTGNTGSKSPSRNAGQFDSATATAVNWLLTGYDISLSGKKIALVGRGRLVGAPLYRMFKNSRLDVSVFGHDSDLTVLRDFDAVISATGVAGLIKSSMISSGTILVDAGTASENGKLVGDVAPEVYERSDLAAITPVKGGVGPLTVAALFENLLRAAKNKQNLRGQEYCIFKQSGV